MGTYEKVTTAFLALLTGPASNVTILLLFISDLMSKVKPA